MHSQREFNFGDHSRSIQDRFEEFHLNNPRIYALIVRFSREALLAGRQHYGMKAIFERIRWHIFVETRSEDDFKLCNDFTSRYARLVMEQEPDLVDFFELRGLKSE